MGYQSQFPAMTKIAPDGGLCQTYTPEDPRFPPNCSPDCENVYYEDGELVSAAGSKAINSTAISGSPRIMRIHGYARSDGSTNLLLQGDGSIYKRATSTTFEKVLDSGITGERYRFANGNNLALTTRAHSQAPAYWDGSNYYILGGAPNGLYPFYYQDHFIIYNTQGGGTSGSQCRQSQQRDIQTWNTTDVFNIETNDGEVGTGVSQQGRYLCCFKNTSRTLIYGTFFKQTASAFDAGKVATIRGIGCESHDCLVMANGNLYTLDRNGIWSIGPDGEVDLITKNIPTFWKSVNINVAGEFSAAHIPEKRRILWSVAKSGSGTPNYILDYSYETGALWPRKLDTHGLIGIPEGARTRVYFGNTSGKLFELFVGEDDNGTAINSYVVWPLFGTDSLNMKKLWDELALIGSSRGSHSNTLESSCDGRLGDRLQSTTYANSNGVTNQETDFEQFVSMAHTGRTLKVKIKSDTIAGGPWALKYITAKGRVTLD